MGSRESNRDTNAPRSLSDVDLDDADRARIDYLSSGGLTDAEAERVVRFGKVPREHRHPEMLRPPKAERDDAHADARSTSHAPDPDTERVCGDIRRRMRDATRPTDVITAYPDMHPSSVFLHAEGRCSCGVDEPPTTSPRVAKDECHGMRSAFRGGATKRDVMADFHRSANAVNKHLFGRCDHDVRRDSTPDHIDRAECGHLRHAYRRNDSVSVHDVAAAFGVSASVAHKHLRGRCDHDVDVTPIASQEVDSGTCTAMRRAFQSSVLPIVATIASDHGVTRPTADYHIFGRCACDADEPPASRPSRN